MPLKQVTFSKKYPYDKFLNYDLGYVWEMEEGEVREDIEAMLLTFANDNHKKNYPHLYQEEPIIKTTQPIEQTVTSKDDRIGRYLAIQAATTLEELEAVKIQPEDKLDIPYNTQKKKLQAK